MSRATLFGKAFWLGQLNSKKDRKRCPTGRCLRVESLEDRSLLTALDFSTYLGGNATDYAVSTAVDAQGNVYVAGTTFSADFPVTSGALQTTYQGGGADVFVAKYSPAGQLLWATYLGGAGSDDAAGIAVDSAGQVFVSGNTSSLNFPTVSAPQNSNAGGSDLFFAKLNSSGTSLIYSSYLGGGGADLGGELALDSSGSAYLVGQTSSSNFPTLNALQSSLGGARDAVVAKIDSSGALQYSTYLGGSYDENPTRIAVDSSGSAYVAGGVIDGSFLAVNAFQPSYAGGYQDGFLAKIDPSGGSLAYATNFGGSDYEDIHAIDVDASGSAYVTGDTFSSDFPVQNALQASIAGGSDAFVAKFNPSGSALVYSTYLGGASVEQGLGIAVDGFGNAYVAGHTQSADFPVASPIQAALAGGKDAFATGLNATGSGLLYSTYLGGSGSDGAHGITVSAAGTAVLFGLSNSLDFPTDNAHQSTNHGDFDAFVTSIGSVVLPADGFTVETQAALNTSKSGDIVANLTALGSFDQATLDALANGMFDFRFVFTDSITTVTVNASIVAGSYLGTGDADFSLSYHNPGATSPLNALVTAANSSASKAMTVHFSVEVKLGDTWCELGSDAIKAFLSKK